MPRRKIQAVWGGGGEATPGACMRGACLALLAANKATFQISRTAAEACAHHHPQIRSPQGWLSSEHGEAALLHPSTRASASIPDAPTTSARPRVRPVGVCHVGRGAGGTGRSREPLILSRFQPCAVWLPGWE